MNIDYMPYNIFMEIILRPHQVIDMKGALSNGIEDGFVERHGQAAFDRLIQIIAIIQANPETPVRVAYIDIEHIKYPGLSVCGADCKRIGRSLNFCQKRSAVDDELRFANKLGLEMGAVYKASELFNISK